MLLSYIKSVYIQNVNHAGWLNKDILDADKKGKVKQE